MKEDFIEKNKVDHYNDPFPSRLRDLMEKRKLTQADMCDVFHVDSRQAVSSYANGKNEPSLRQLADVSQFFGVSSDYLLGKTDVKTPDASIRGVSSFTGLSEGAIRALTDLKNEKFLSSSDNSALTVLDKILQKDAFIQYLKTASDLYVYCLLAKRIIDGEPAEICIDAMDCTDVQICGGSHDPYYMDYDVLQLLYNRLKNATYQTMIASEYFHSVTSKGSTLCARLVDRVREAREKDSRWADPPEDLYE